MRINQLVTGEGVRLDSDQAEQDVDEQPVETTIYSLSDDVPPPAERRESERHLTVYRVGTLTVDGSPELCLIRNLSAGGMMIRAYCLLTEGSPVQVEMKQGEKIAATVSWARGEVAGLAFDEPIDVVRLLSLSMEGPRPRMPRIETRCMASVRHGAKVYGLIAHDISQGGVKVDGNRDLAVGSEVVVTLPGLPTQKGVIRWEDGGCYGITFSRLLALPDLIAWLDSQRGALRRAC